LHELHGVDPELGVVAERPALAGADDFFAGLRGEIGEHVAQRLALDRRARARLGDVFAAVALEAAGSAALHLASLLVHAAFIRLGLGTRDGGRIGAGAAGAGARVVAATDAGDQGQRKETSGSEVAH
jgi:hypothetical protein